MQPRKPIYDYNADPENVIAAEPDLVLIRPFINRKSPDFVAALENAGLTVVSLYPESFEEFDGYIEKLAMLTGTSGIWQYKNWWSSIMDLQRSTHLTA